MTTVPSSSAAALDPLLCFDLYAASRAMTARYRPLLDELGITYPQYLVLVVLREETPCTVKDVAVALQLDHATLTPLLRRMEQADLLSRGRAASDGRSVLLSLTERGRAVAARLDDVRCAVQQTLGLDEEQTRALQATLRVLTASG